VSRLVRSSTSGTQQASNPFTNLRKGVHKGIFCGVLGAPPQQTTEQSLAVTLDA
jgi:hypothetical protein